MKKSEFYFGSSDGRTQIRTVEWAADEPCAVLLLVHGIAEHIDRYDAFASFLADNGITVVGNDILGHGKSIASKDDLGFFAENDGWFTCVEDINLLRKQTAEKYASLPYFIFGHSMGSFLTRTYITKYAEGLSGVVISGTGANPEVALTVGRAVAGIVAKKGGSHAKSETIRKMCFGSYNKRIESPMNENEWLSRDTAVSEKYCNDELCGFLPCATTYREMFRGISYIQKKNNIARVPKLLPMLFVSGTDDPVGSYGKGVEQAVAGYKNAGIKDIEVKLYDGGRHEMLNEINREEVYADIFGWIKKKTV